MFANAYGSLYEVDGWLWLVSWESRFCKDADAIEVEPLLTQNP